MKRREFLLTATGAAMTAALAGDTLAQTAHKRDVSYEPNRPLESTGLSISDGVKILKKGARESIIELKIRQGMNRQVRRMLAKVYLPVKSLKRIAIGKINLKGIGPGNYRKLKPNEIEYLKKTTSKK